MNDSAESAAPQAEAAAGELLSRIVKARVTYILDDGTELIYQEIHCRPGFGLNFTVPAPGDIEVTS